MTVTRAGPIVEQECDISVGHLYKWTLRGVNSEAGDSGEASTEPKQVYSGC